MTVLVFVDTNVLIYAVDEGDPKKQEAAKAWQTELWKSRSGRLSFQVLQEFYAKVCQKSAGKREEAKAKIRNLLEWHPVSIDADVLESAWKIQDRYKISFWDALIVAAAKAASCKYLLTEDLQEGQEMDGVVVVNPFRSSPREIAAE